MKKILISILLLIQGVVGMENYPDIDKVLSKKKYLNFDGIDIDDKKLQYIAEKEDSLQCAQNISFRYCNLTKESFDNIVKIAKMPHLQYLDISGNEIIQGLDEKKLKTLIDFNTPHLKGLILDEDKMDAQSKKEYKLNNNLRDKWASRKHTNLLGVYLEFKKDINKIDDYAGEILSIYNAYN